MEHSGPIPNGYAMVRLPHFCGQPGFDILFGALEVVMVAHDIAIEEKRRSSHWRFILYDPNFEKRDWGWVYQLLLSFLYPFDFYIKQPQLLPAFQV